MFPLDMTYGDNMTLGKILFNTTYHHCVFLNPGAGIYLQTSG